MTESTSPELSIVVLAYNEAENVGRVLDELYAWPWEHTFEVILIDDGSSDGTRNVAQQHLRPTDKTIRHEHNRGMGAGLKTGAAAAQGRWLTFIPADGQIPPRGIATLARAGDEDVDLVLSVYEDRNDGATRTALSWGVRALIEMVHGVRLRSDGPYLVRRRLFDPAQLQADTFFLNFELPIRAAAAGLRTRTVSMRCRPRMSGKSKTARPGRALRVAGELLAFRGRRLADAMRRAVG